MNYCMDCGTKLEIRHEEHEGNQLYCPSCQKFCYAPFHVAVSLLVIHPDKQHVLLIQQYNRPSNILVAGYVNKGECAEDALKRELMEEIGLTCDAWRYLKSEYFAKSNTLMMSYAVLASSDSLESVSTWEVDKAEWFSLEEAPISIRQNSLAQQFLMYFLDVYNTSDQFFYNV